MGENLLHLHLKVNLVGYKILASDVFTLVIILDVLLVESIAVEILEENLIFFPLYPYDFCLDCHRNFLSLINTMILLEYVLICSFGGGFPGYMMCSFNL